MQREKKLVLVAGGLGAVVGGAAISMLATPVAHAASAAAATPTATPAAVRLDDDNAKRVAEIPNLRKARQALLDIQKMLSNDVIDPKGYRHESLAHITQAIDLITNEINEYKGDAK